MKLCRFNDNRLGVVLDDVVADVTNIVEGKALIPPWPLPHGDWLIANLEKLRPSIEASLPTAKRINLSDIQLLSPVANPGKIIGAPVNYYAHQEEANNDAEISFDTKVKTIEHYGLFLKATSSLIGPSQGIKLRYKDRRNDHEAELVIVIGKRCDQVNEIEALDYVLGYCAGLDMTVRGTEERSLRKSIDTYTVLGPWLTTSDEVINPQDLHIKLEVNNELRQDCSTSYMIFGLSKLISYASSFYTLYPGDIIMTGTPSGVGPVNSGDIINLNIDQIGDMKVKVS